MSGPRLYGATAFLSWACIVAARPLSPGTLARLGATPPKTLMEGLPDNPRGYWESFEFFKLHDALLESAGSRWQDWREFSQGWYATPVAAGFKARAKVLLASEFGDAPTFILKDPRICRFARFWLEIFQEECVTEDWTDRWTCSHLRRERILRG